VEKEKDRSMGNTVNIPQESGNGWVILHVDRQCIEVTVSSDQAADPKLLAFGVQPHDFRHKMEDFSTQVNAQVKPAYYKMFGAISFATIFANIGTRLLEFNVAMALTIAYIPLIWSIWVLIKTMKGLPEKISTVFESWKGLGITAEYYPGSKHSKPRLGFKLPTDQRGTNAARFPLRSSSSSSPMFNK